MISFDQFIGLLRSCLRDTKGVEVALGPYMLTCYLCMNRDEWQGFAAAAARRYQFEIEQCALSGSSTILDLYYASLSRSQPLQDMPALAENAAAESGRKLIRLH